jgi:hypothetical protein
LLVFNHQGLIGFAAAAGELEVDKTVRTCSFGGDHSDQNMMNVQKLNRPGIMRQLPMWHSVATLDSIAGGVF